eukprot:TRINITY_DN13336_c0_g1_i1.p1 TRINITY_DN13336_c0_g1~~TRINITY_DN13336_c0_g1_i1.p1  ORF type:complete len:122 (+),score=33.88 TRINITY_DN13336_c0_g1_i1:95-460(+)
MLFVLIFFFFLMIRRPPRSTLSSSSAASDVYKRQGRPDPTNLRGQSAPPKPPSCLVPVRDRRVAPVGPTAQCLSLIHISEPTRLLSISYAVFCLKKKKKKQEENNNTTQKRTIKTTRYKHI